MKNRFLMSSIQWIVRYCTQFIIIYILSVVLNKIFALMAISYRVPLSLVIVVSIWSIIVSYYYKRKKEKQGGNGKDGKMNESE